MDEKNNNEIMDQETNETETGANDATDQALSFDKVKDYIETNEDAKKYLQSQRDKSVREGIKKFMGEYANEEGNMETIMKKKMEALREELNPKESEAEKRIREMNQKIVELEERALKKELQAFAFVKAQEYGLPKELNDLIRLGGDQETTEHNISFISDVFQKAVEKSVEDRLKGDVRKPDRSKLSIKDQLIQDHSKMDDDAYFRKEIERRKKNGNY